MRIFGLLLVLALFFSCASRRDIARERKGRCVIKDSARYELIVFDVGFDYWLATHNTIANQRGNEYYRGMNQLYVTEWNRRYAAGDPLVNSYIDYSAGKNHGLEFNYKLYMYFKFFEEKNRIRLIPGNRML